MFITESRYSFKLSKNNLSYLFRGFIVFEISNNDLQLKLINVYQTKLRSKIVNYMIIFNIPIKTSVFVGYNLENKTSEEEITFAVSRADLEKLAYAKKTVTVELNGKHRTVNARFNKWSTFRAFKNFVSNT